jgi:hypothetical protein
VEPVKPFQETQSGRKGFPGPKTFSPMLESRPAYTAGYPHETATGRFLGKPSKRALVDGSPKDTINQDLRFNDSHTRIPCKSEKLWPLPEVWSNPGAHHPVALLAPAKSRVAMPNRSVRPERGAGA